MKSNTYLKERKCPHCLTSIPDQAHALQKYCKRVKLEDGSVHSCKDDFNSAKRKIEKTPFKGFAIHHENMRNRIRSLFQNHGEIVNVELLNQYRIILNRPAQIEWPKDGSTAFYFVDYAIIKKQNTFKIIKHGRVYK